VNNEAYTTRYYYSEKPGTGEQLALSLYISSNAFMYTLSTGNFKTVVELCHVEMIHPANSPFDLTDKVSFLVNNYLLHQKKFEKVNVAFLNTEFTMVPEAFAGNTDLKPLLKFTTGVPDIRRSLQHNLRDLNFCFNLEPGLVSYLERTFPNASVRHAGAVTISLLFGHQALLPADLYLNIGDSFIELAAKEKNGLLFYNVFGYESNDDVLYYILFMMEQFNLNPLHVKLAIAAERAVTDDLIKNIKKYVKQVGFCVVDPSIKMRGDMSSLPHHYYFGLLSQHVCEL
jgi:hypothetical protein